MSLFTELTRRKVFKVGGAYLVVAWLAVQAASIGFPAFDAPSWTLRIFILVALLGFPISLVFAWAFELTPNGVRPESGARSTRAILSIATVLTLLAFVWYFKGQPSYRPEMPPNASVAATKSPSTDAVIAVAPISKKSIAVLPFTDLSPTHDQEYFSDGMSEELLNALAKVKDLKVAGRTSSFSFKGKNEDLRTIGKTLSVANILEGSVRKQGDKVRITAQLIQTEDGFHLWSESYDGDLSDVFELQERIARAITDQLKVALQGDQQTRLARQTTQNVEAYQGYLRGRYFWYRRGYGNLQNAVTALKAALTADPDYAEAWAALAQTYAVLPEYSVVDPESTGRVDSAPLALDAADRALKLDPDSSSALQARAYMRVMREFDWAGADADYRAAIARNPRDPTAHQWYGELLMYQRRWPEAAVQYDAALAIDPLTPIIHLSRALFLWYRGDPAAALLDFDESLRLEPDFHVVTFEKIKVLVELRRFDQATAAARGLPAGEREAVMSFIAAMQDPAQTDAAVREIMAHAPGGLIGKPMLLAMLGRNELALDELEQLFRERDPYCVFLGVIPAYAPLHQNPRFQALLQQIKLPQASEVKGVQNP